MKLFLNIIFALLINFSFAQTTKKQTWIEKQRNADGGLYFGLSTLYYNIGLVPLEIYKFDIENTNMVSKKFNHVNVAPGLSVGIFINGNGDFKQRFEFSRNSVRTSCEFLDAKSNTVTSKIKILNSQLRYIFSYQPINLEELSLGCSADIGTIRTRQKFIGDGYSGKWQPFYYNALTNGSMAPTIGLSLFASFRVKDFTFSINRQSMLYH